MLTSFLLFFCTFIENLFIKFKVTNRCLSCNVRCFGQFLSSGFTNLESEKTQDFKHPTEISYDL